MFLLKIDILLMMTNRVRAACLLFTSHVVPFLVLEQIRPSPEKGQSLPGAAAERWLLGL